jgi:hypothetical protein
MTAFIDRSGAVRGVTRLITIVATSAMLIAVPAASSRASAADPSVVPPGGVAGV